MTSNMHKISAIIPVFNRFDFLRRALVCLQNQSMQVDEVVITDDGSSPDLLVNLKKLAPDLSMPVKYIRQDNKGFRLSKVRNNGVRVSSGDWLIFLDQDIIYTKRFIETFVKHFHEKKFIVSWPVRLTEQQTLELTDEQMKNGNYENLITSRQIYEVGKQFRKDLFYVVCKKLRVRSIGPKLRGGLFAVSRDNYDKVNGFDENYRGWGNEDDDLGRRLDAAGITGKNPFWKEYPLHMWHEPYREGTKRVNLEYYRASIERTRKGEFYCEYGIHNPLEHETCEYLEL